MFESRNNNDAIIFYFYIFTTTYNNLLLWLYWNPESYIGMVSELDPGWTFCDIFKVCSLLFCDW